MSEELMVNEKYHFFWKGKSPLTNWYQSIFYHRMGNSMLIFSCMEQFMMFSKAIIFNDLETGMKILNTAKPSEHKTLGREIKNFNQEQWDAVKENIVYQGLHEKFTQDSDLADYLLGTGDKLLVEANPEDKIWGIGIDEETARKTPEAEWPGQNLLGKQLTKLRDELKRQLALHDTKTTDESVPAES